MKGISQIQPHVTGADIGAHEIVVCVAGVQETQIIRTSGNYTIDLHLMAKWLLEQGVRSVAMVGSEPTTLESTGVYWILLFETLEDFGLQCCLISATAIKRLPGRKSDVLDCQWIQTAQLWPAG